MTPDILAIFDVPPKPSEQLVLDELTYISYARQRDDWATPEQCVRLFGDTTARRCEARYLEELALISRGEA